MQTTWQLNFSLQLSLHDSTLTTRTWQLNSLTTRTWQLNSLTTCLCMTRFFQLELQLIFTTQLFYRLDSSSFFQQSQVCHGSHGLTCHHTSLSHIHHLHLTYKKGHLSQDATIWFSTHGQLLGLGEPHTPLLPTQGNTSTHEVTQCCHK